ncbi:MAG: hypothetical protein ACI4CT_06350 [Lachnospiraceae bacterium]
MKKRILFPVLLLLFLCTFVYFMFFYQRTHERSTTYTETNTIPAVQSLSKLMNTLSYYDDLTDFAFSGRENEVQYGTYIIPGLLETVTMNHADHTTSICTSMTPQGLTVTDQYVIISAYCYTHTHQSVLYLLDRDTHNFIKEVILPTRAHVGGLAYDELHNNLWVSGATADSASVICIPMRDIINYDYRETQGAIPYQHIYRLKTISAASFLDIHNHTLYVGDFSSKSDSYMETFPLNSKGLLNEAYYYHIDSLFPAVLPNSLVHISERYQGISITDDYIFVSQSYGAAASRLYIFKNNGNIQTLKKSEAIGTFWLPQKLEQIEAKENHLYLLFESAASAYRHRSYPRIDRVLTCNIAKMMRFIH